jgi:hypothetical protein
MIWSIERVQMAGGSTYAFHQSKNKFKRIDDNRCQIVTRGLMYWGLQQASRGRGRFESECRGTNSHVERRLTSR